MPRKPVPSGPLPPNMALAMKDGLRELRVNLRQGAQTLARKIEATSHKLDELEGPLGRLPKLGEPLAAAARTAVQIIETADHAAVDLLTSDGDFRRMNFRLRPAAHYFLAGGNTDGQERAFTKAHYWALRHLLQLKGAADVVVHEQAVDQVFRQVQGQPAVIAGVDAAAAVLLALCRSEDPALLHRSGEEGAAAAERRVFYSTAAVLAGQIAVARPDPDAQAETRQALTVADEIVSGTLGDWQRALRAPEPRQALAEQISFTLRYT